MGTAEGGKALNLEVRDLYKVYDENIILRGISLRLEKGEVTGIIGPSGAGKSTLLRILNLLEEPTSGEVLFEGSPMPEGKKERLELRRRMTMVFQKPVVFNTSVFNNVAYGLKLRGYRTDDIEKLVNEALKNVGFENGEKNALKLSGGEAQRVALARAMVLNPDTLLLDEPTANLDPGNVRLFEEGLLKMAENTTIVLATHNLHQAKRLAGRVVFMLAGELIEVGDVGEVFSNPTDERTDRFLKGEMVY